MPHRAAQAQLGARQPGYVEDQRSYTYIIITIIIITIATTRIIVILMILIIIIMVRGLDLGLPMPSVTRRLALLFIPKHRRCRDFFMAATHNPLPCRDTSGDIHIIMLFAWIIPITSRPSSCYGSYCVATTYYVCHEASSSCYHVLPFLRRRLLQASSQMLHTSR